MPRTKNIRTKGRSQAGEGSSGTLSSGAQRRYDEALDKGKIMIAERGIPLLSTIGTRQWLAVEADELGWATFCAPREPAAIPVVREFYAQVPEHRDGKIRMRGTVVDFNADTINRMFDLPVPEVDEFEQLRNSELPAVYAVDVCRVLTDGRGRWASRGGVVVSLERKHFTSRAKTWFYFVAFTMLPVSHHNLCRREPALLIYAIMQRMRINVGNLIFRGILQSSEPAKGFWFPLLITMLCRQAGVSIGEGEETLRPGRLMDIAYINRLCMEQDFRDARIARRQANAPGIAEEGPSGSTAPLALHQPEDHNMPDAPAPDASNNDVIRMLRQMRRESRLRHGHADDNMRRIDHNIRFQWEAAGYDLSQYQSVVPWEQSSHASEWAGQDDDEEDDVSQHQSSEEE